MLFTSTVSSLCLNITRYRKRNAGEHEEAARPGKALQVAVLVGPSAVVVVLLCVLPLLTGKEEA